MRAAQSKPARAETSVARMRRAGDGRNIPAEGRRWLQARCAVAPALFAPSSLPRFYNACNASLSQTNGQRAGAACGTGANAAVRGA
jgi:hypothetical protein